MQSEDSDQTGWMSRVIIVISLCTLNDTCWATQQQTIDGIIVPSKMKLGIPLRAAGDYFNIATESLDGKHLDIVNTSQTWYYTVLPAKSDSEVMFCLRS